MKPPGPGTGSDYLKDMARAGGGSFQALAADSLCFDIQVTPITRGLTFDQLYLMNFSRRVSGDLLLPGSGQDGVGDALELSLGLDPFRPDTGGVGCHDRTHLTAGENASLCPRICSRDAAAGGMLTAPLGDDDGDSLLNCEEVALTLIGNRADSDGDQLTDDLELRFGTNPRDLQTWSLDSDLDGATDALEMLHGTDPVTRQTDGEGAYLYAPLEEVAGSQGRCRHFRVDNVRLVETAVSAAGDNLICVYMVQHTADDPQGQPAVSLFCQMPNLRTLAGQGGKSPA